MQVLKLILLDNEQEIIDSLRDAFDERFSVEGFTNLEDCLQYLRLGAHPHMILTDYNFNSSLNGLDYVDVIRKVTNRNIPFILVTGSVINDLEQLSKAGCLVIQKPFHVATLMKQVIEVWMKHIETELSDLAKVD